MAASIDGARDESRAWKASKASREWRRQAGLRWAWLVGLGVIHSGIVYVLFYSSYPRLPVVTIAVVAFVYPLVTLILDYQIGRAHV